MYRNKTYYSRFNFNIMIYKIAFDTCYEFVDMNIICVHCAHYLFFDNVKQTLYDEQNREIEYLTKKSFEHIKNEFTTQCNIDISCLIEFDCERSQFEIVNYIDQYDTINELTNFYEFEHDAMFVEISNDFVEMTKRYVDNCNELTQQMMHNKITKIDENFVYFENAKFDKTQFENEQIDMINEKINEL